VDADVPDARKGNTRNLENIARLTNIHYPPIGSFRFLSVIQMKPIKEAKVMKKLEAVLNLSCDDLG